MEAFLLGISSGAICVAYCAPVLLPYFAGEGKTVYGNFLILSLFLSGRLIGYLIFAVIAWGIGRSIIQAGSLRELIIGAVYIILSLLLLIYAFLEMHPSCSASFTKPLQWAFRIHPLMLPISMGLATGLNFCPPFLLAITGAAERGSLLKSIYFFSAFFLGTSIFFIPVPFLGLLRRYQVLKTIGKLAAGLMGLYYLYSGSMMLIGGVKKI